MHKIALERRLKMNMKKKPIPAQVEPVVSCECVICCDGEHAGKCKECAGWGDRIIKNTIKECEYCGGSGICPVCNGTANVELSGGESGESMGLQKMNESVRAFNSKADGCEPSVLSDVLSDNMIECFNCGRTVYLTMFAHRRNKKIVGWIFLCTACASIMADKEMELIVR